MRFAIMPSICALVLGVSIFLMIFSMGDTNAGFPLDDSWIHLQFARNFANGDGFGLNPSEPTAGSTSPLWTLLLSGIVKTGIPPFYGAIVLAFVLLAVSSAFVARLAGMIFDSRVLVIAASVFVVFSPALIWSSLAGLEISLFVFLCTIGLWLIFASRKPGHVIAGYFALALSTQARPEGYLLFVLTIVVDTIRGYVETRSPRVVALLAGKVFMLIAVSAPYVIFSEMTSGHLFPNSLYAKTTGEYSLMPSPAYFLAVYRIFFSDNPVAAVLFPVGLVSLAVREFRSGRVSVGTLFVLWPLALPVAFSTMGRTALFAGAGGNFGRYYYILIPVLVILSMEGIRIIGSWASLASDNIGKITRLALVVLVLVAGVFTNFSRGRDYALNVKNINEINVDMAEWVAKNTPKSAVIAANDVGALAYIGERKIIDLIGITNPDIIPRRATRAGVVEYLSEVEPDYLCVFDAWYPATIRVLMEVGVMKHLHSVSIDDNITCGGDLMSIFSLDWRAARRGS